MNDQDLTKTDYDPDRSLVLSRVSHFLTNLLRNLASCQTSLNKTQKAIITTHLKDGVSLLVIA
jgi:hypothetical protein